VLSVLCGDMQWCLPHSIPYIASGSPHKAELTDYTSLPPQGSRVKGRCKSTLHLRTRLTERGREASG